MDPLLLAFVGVALLVTLTPGADMALVAGVTLRHGPRLGRFAGWGTATGLFVHGLAAALGLSALLLRSALLFGIVKALGAAYLMFLGGRALWAAFSAAKAPRDQGPADGALGALAAKTEPEPAAMFARGVLTNVLNPKIAVFYVAFLPQFAQPGEPFLPRALLLSAIHAGMNYAWLPLYAAGVARLGAMLRGAWQRALEGATGALLVLVGVRLLVERAPE